MKVCSIEACEAEYFCKGWCQRHYSQARYAGHPSIQRRQPRQHGSLTMYNNGCRCDECKVNWNAYAREAKRKDKERDPEKWARRLFAQNIKKLYGITIEQYDAMHDEQGGKCAICNRVGPGRGRERLCVDHCHETGQVRGLLCVSCNSAIGMLGDSVEHLLSALDYLLTRTESVPAEGVA